MDRIEFHREFMKSLFASLPPGMSDQSKGLPQPPLELPCGDSAEKLPLPKPDERILANNNLFDCVARRSSRRQWTKEPLTFEELSFLLWATQGVKEVMGGNYATLRTVPSAGARHPFETYVLANRVDGLEPGVYRYLPLTHELLRHACAGDRHEAIHRFDAVRAREQLRLATFGQGFVADGAAVFMWACVPYRGEWRYTIAAHKVMLLDAGHMAQNLYLACEAIGAGTCTIGAYDQEALDRLLGLDGHEQYSIYLAPVGKIAQ